MNALTLGRKDSEPTGSLLPEREPRAYGTPRGRRALILPRLLEYEARLFRQRDDLIQPASEIIHKWADLELASDLRKKETAIDANFLFDLFGTALRYPTATENPERYSLERNFAVPGVGTADGAIGHFGRGTEPRPFAVIEFKDAETNLDRDRTAGRTPVQQCWDYLNALPLCPWGIVSNFVTIRLYHRDKTPLAFEVFRLQELRNPTRLRQFFALFSRDALLPTRLVAEPPALRLLRQTDVRQREVGDDLYEAYRRNRLALIDHLHRRHRKPIDTAIQVAQKILDRIIFVAFCEDRRLLPERTIESAYTELPPLTKVTNPRWQNFLNLFRAVDEGNEKLHLLPGYDGGLFRHDPEVDNLQLDDEWTGFFKEVSTYDFRDEVNVDVLGHLFEKSVTELEKLRAGGLFDTTEPASTKLAEMPRSGQRKRFGIFYTPVDFTRFLVDHTLGELIRERLAQVAATHGVDPDRPPGPSTDHAPRRYWEAYLATLSEVRICDPACGSGAFLIQAYDVLEEHYNTIADALGLIDEQSGRQLAEDIPDIILSRNLYGVDLSSEAVEITQLALWIRSARRGKTLADLSANIVCGNSLVADPSVDRRAIRWMDTVPDVFSGENPGFDCVVSNPPWERMKLQEREFFALSAPVIAAAVSAAKRRSMIAELQEKDPLLFSSYLRAKERAEGALQYVRTCGDFPLTAMGDINTYALFAELAEKLVSPLGRVGLLVPSGIASDNTTKEFFARLMDTGALRALLDFENRKGVFPDVDRRFKFCCLLFGGAKQTTPSADFVFYAHGMEDFSDRDRHIALTASDLKLVNPNTRTCPVFRSRRDAELTKAIYHRVPVLVDEARKERGNPWGLTFKTMFHQTNDAELFHAAEQLKRSGFKLHGNIWRKGKQRFLPLYEAKMVQAYDHRAASVVVDPDNWMRQGQTIPTSLVQHQNPDYVVQPRWWVHEQEVRKALGGDLPPALLSYKDVTSPTNERTMIAAMIPAVGVLNSAPLILVDGSLSLLRYCCLLANLNAFVLDYVARQKVGNIHLNFYIVKQLPMLRPDAYAERCPWDAKRTLERWISDRVLKLTCTAEDMRPLAEACRLRPPVHKWRLTDRADLMAELDAAYFLLYGVSREDTEYILTTFPSTMRRDKTETGGYRTSHLILDAFDRLSDASGR